LANNCVGAATEQLTCTGIDLMSRFLRLLQPGGAAMKLYDSAFSPFARKVRLVLEHKGLSFEAVDGLLKSSHDDLKAVNGRVEVPALVDGDIVVVNSADIVAFLEHRYPEKPVYPPRRCRTRARARLGAGSRHADRRDLDQHLVLALGGAARRHAGRSLGSSSQGVGAGLCQAGAGSRQ
jgi:Glutathione S-transferase, N-terminal domain